MHQAGQTEQPLEPQIKPQPHQRGSWFPASESDPIVGYIQDNLWHEQARPHAWEVAPLLGAAYLYREKSTHWPVVAKFYVAKMRDEAQKFAQHELELTRQAASFGLEDGPTRALHAWAAWRGVLFLEYVDGLTLQDVIAIRRSRLGEPHHSLGGTVRLLATLHANSVQSQVKADFAPAVEYARQMVGQLSEGGPLRYKPLLRDGALRLIGRWQDRPAMSRFTPTYIHGDATAANFSFLPGSQVVGTDWERLHVADPADDLGRLMAEVSRSIVQYGGDASESEPLIRYMAETYASALPADWDADALLERARFYRAASVLRIARNEWVPELDSLTLIAEALVLLA